MTGTEHPDVIRASEAARRLGIHPLTLKRWSEKGVIPEPVRIGPGGYRHYRVTDIDALIQNGATS